MVETEEGHKMDGFDSRLLRIHTKSCLNPVSRWMHRALRPDTVHGHSIH